MRGPPGPSARASVRSAAHAVRLALVTLAMASCSEEARPSGATRATGPDLVTPATFTDGTVTVTLFDDGTFRLRTGAAREDARDLGSWSADPAGGVELRGAHETRRAVLVGDTLRLGGPSGVEPRRRLVRADVLDAIDEPMPLRGMMVYLADAGRFTECSTGASYWIAPEGAARELERAYLARGTPGEPLLVEVVGALTRREGMEGGEVAALVVAGFTDARPGVGCDLEAADRPLENVDWVLIELPGGADVPGGGAASIRFDRERRVASGSTGCNRFSGSYDLTGPRLTVAPGAMTRMACADPGLDAVERDFLEALRVTGSARVLGDRLELIGESGAVARLRARDP